MDSSVSLKDHIWFLRVCHHVSNVLYLQQYRCANPLGFKIYEHYGSHMHLTGTIPLCCALRTPLVQDNAARTMCLSGFWNLPPTCVWGRCSRRSVGAGDVFVRDRRSPVRIAGGQKFHTSCRTHPTSCSVATSVKRPGRVAEYLPASSSESKNAGLTWTVKPTLFLKRRMVTYWNHVTHTIHSFWRMLSSEKRCCVWRNVLPPSWG